MQYKEIKNAENLFKKELNSSLLRTFNIFFLSHQLVFPVNGCRRLTFQNDLLLSDAS